MKSIRRQLRAAAPTTSRIPEFTMTIPLLTSVRPVQDASSPPARRPGHDIGVRIRHDGRMPEGDTVWLTAKRLNDGLAGQEVTVFDLRVPALATSDLRGELVCEVVARGKHIMTRFGNDLTLHSHLRMDGSWYLVRAGQRPRHRPEHMIRALIGNRDWLATGYRVHDLKIVRTADEHVLVGHLGPDVLGPDWDPEEAARRLATQPGRPIGEALLDQANLAGIGNMYKAEILYVQKVNPWTPVRDVADLPGMLRTSYRLLRMNRDHPEQSTTGSTVRGREHWVYLRHGQPCRACGTPIRAAEQDEQPRQRITYWCPTCQPSPGGVTAPRSPAARRDRPAPRR